MNRRQWTDNLWLQISDLDVPDGEYALHEEFFLDAMNELFDQALNPIHAAKIIVDRYHLYILNNLTTWEETKEFINQQSKV